MHTRGALARACHLALWSAAIGFPTVANAEDTNVPERPPTRAYLVADGDGFTIYPLGDHALVRADGLIAELSDQGLLTNSAFTKLPRLPSMSWLFGRWPDAVWLMQGSESAAQTDDYFTWKNGRWQLMTTLPSKRVLLQVLPQAAGGLLAAFSGESPSGLELLPFGIDATYIKPVPARTTSKGCATKLSPVAVSGLTDGVVVAVGKVCSTVDAAAEIWSPNKARGNFEILPLLPETPVRINENTYARRKTHLPIEVNDVYVRAVNDVYVVGNAEVEEMPGLGGVSYLAHYDGKTWSILPVPDHLWPTRITGTSDGWLFIVGSGFPATKLWRRSPEGDWQTILFDAPEIPGGWVNSGFVPQFINSIWAKAADDFWVTADYTQRDCGGCFHYSALFHSQPPDKKLHLPRKTPGGVSQRHLPSGKMVADRPPETPADLPVVEDMQALYRKVQKSTRHNCEPGKNKFWLRPFWGWTTYIPRFPYRIYIDDDCVLTGMTDDQGALLHRGVPSGDYCVEIGGSYSYIYSFHSDYQEPPPAMWLDPRGRAGPQLRLPDSDADFRRRCARRMVR